MISQLIDSIYRSIQEENIHWDEIVKQLNEEMLLSIERYHQMENRLNDAKIFMRCIVYKKITDKQKKAFKHSNIMCSIKQWQNEKSTQTIYDKKLLIQHESPLIEDVICKFI